ncbi:hypothetical protein [Methylocaldum sp. 14B]|uniref:hypothetical protein n=1 Tax=Methylocaldum sp. 14B TaxID=1912213 RepID=UPI00098A38CE|nr:hypothetical protein [Methylocaldum sp. 14B]
MRGTIQRLAWAGVGLGMAVARPSFGVDWHLEAAASVSQQYHSNIQLLPDRLDPQAVFGTDLGFTTQLVAAEPHWQVKSRARLQNLFYTPIDAIDTQNQYLDLDAHYATERSRWALTVNHTDDALLSSQSDVLVGIVLTRVQRAETTVAPSWTYALDERTRLTLGYAYQASDYEARAGFAFVSSTAHTASSGLEHQLTERLLLSGTLAYTAYRADRRAIDYLNALAGFQYALTETLEVGVSGGGQFSDSETQLETLRLDGFQIVSLDPLLLVPVTVQETVTLKDRQFGPLVTASARQRFDTGDVELNYAHQISPSINGTLFESDRVTVTARRQVSERLNAALNLSYTDQSLPDANGDRLTQAYYRIGGDLSYAVTERWRLGASYQYTLRDLGERGGLFSGRQEAHAVFVTLKYDFDPFQF